MLRRPYENDSGVQNPITEGDFKWIFACNCEGTEQLRNIAQGTRRNRAVTTTVLRTNKQMPLAKAGKALRRRKQSQDTWCRDGELYFWAEEIFILLNLTRMEGVPGRSAFLFSMFFECPEKRGWERSTKVL